MRTRDFGWLSAGRQAQLSARVEALTRQWLTEWSVHSADAVFSPHLAVASPVWFCAYENQHAMVAFGFSDGSAAHLGAWMAQVPSDADTLLARDLGSAALTDLAARLLGVPAQQSATLIQATAIDAANFEPRFKAFRQEMQFGQRSVVMALDHGANNALIPLKVKPSSGLVSRAAALACSQTALELRLPLGRFAIADFLTLRPGDVLRSDVPLSAPFSLGSGTCNLPFECRLVRSGQHKAVYLETTRESP